MIFKYFRIETYGIVMCARGFIFSSDEEIEKRLKRKLINTYLETGVSPKPISITKVKKAEWVKIKKDLNND